MLPPAEPINVLQGSVPVAEICLVRSIDAVWSFTTREAVAAFPVPPSVEVTAVVVLFLVPEIVPVTIMLNVQLLFATSDPPLKAIVLGAVVVKDPPHVVVGPLVVTVKPLTSVSLKPIPVKALFRLGLVIVNVSVAVFPVKIEVGENDLARTGGAITVREEVA